MIQQITDCAAKKKTAASILRALPNWFGIPESTAEYIEQSAFMPFWADVTDGCARGFIALKETSPYAAEIYVMGVLPAYHRQGIGRALFQTLYDYALDHGYLFLQVKTVQEGHYREYDLTNAFYKSVGFLELECLPTLWDEANPCQILMMNVKSL